MGESQSPLDRRNSRVGLSTIRFLGHSGIVREIVPEPVAEPEAALREPGWVRSPATVGVGLVVPYDFALDRELWQWCPDEVCLHITRTPHVPLDVGLAQARAVSEPEALAQATRDLLTVSPRCVAYGCTSGSFVGGLAGESALRRTMIDAGAATAVSTSGALIAALTALHVRRVSIVTPYDEAMTKSLSLFLAEAGFEVVSTGHLGLDNQIWTVPEEITEALVRGSVVPSAEAVFISCTNLRSYGVLASLEASLGIPVLSANQVTIWQALGMAGTRALGQGQALLQQDAAPTSLTCPTTPAEVLP